MAAATFRAWTGVAVVLAAGLLAACAAGLPPARPVAAGEVTVLRPGDAVRLPDASTLRYLRVLGDSRCPPRVVCIHAGEASVLVEHAAVGATHRLVLSTRAEGAVHSAGWVLELVDLGRGTAPAAHLRATRARD